MTTHSITAKPAGNRFTRFLFGIWAEMKKVVWLSRTEITYLTALVLITTVAVGIILGLFDFGFSTAIDKLLLSR